VASQRAQAVAGGLHVGGAAAADAAVTAARRVATPTMGDATPAPAPAYRQSRFVGGAEAQV
jgi:hypothetical protein